MSQSLSVKNERVTQSRRITQLIYLITYIHSKSDYVHWIMTKIGPQVLATSSDNSNCGEFTRVTNSLHEKSDQVTSTKVNLSTPRVKIMPQFFFYFTRLTTNL